MAHRISLSRLILWLSIVSVVAASANSLLASYQVQRDLLIESTLENNRIYAAKLAGTTQNMLLNARLLLAYSASVLGPGAVQGGNEAEAQRIWRQSSYFNSVLVVDEGGKVLATAPEGAGIVGQQLSSVGALGTLRAQMPFITKPYVAATGRWVITISHPILAADGQYRGFVGGTIYLHEANVLHALLGEQLHRDGSYIYVVDEAGTLIYHPDPARIGDSVAGRNQVVDRVLSGEAAAANVENSEGVRMLAGFAPVPQAQWGVVAQRPMGSTLAPLESLLWRTVRNSLPLLVVLLLGTWWMSALIARPLWQMASVVRRMDSRRASSRVSSVKAWYFEAAQLRRALIAGLSSLQGVIAALRQDSMTDTLTGMLNRRGLNAVIEELRELAVPFGVVIVDIDHFKRINDTHGHAVGDEALCLLAQLMRKNSRVGDVLCRTGGEEFLILLPQSSTDETLAIAESLRAAVQDAVTPHGEGMTISLGVSHCGQIAMFPQDALAGADAALYEAKRGGRNRVVVANPPQMVAA